MSHAVLTGLPLSAEGARLPGCFLAGAEPLCPTGGIGGTRRHARPDAAQGAEWVDLDGPLLLAADRQPPLRYEGSTVFPAERGLWG